MTRKALSVYMSATCALMIVAPGRLVCGIILALEIIILMFAGTMLRALCRKIKINDISNTIILTGIIFLTILIKQILMIVMPVISLQLSFVLFIPAISTFTTVFLLDENEYKLKHELKINMVPATFFACYSIIFSLIRDILGFGTITIPCYKQQLEYVLFDPERVSAFTFFGTIPGALILSALFLAMYLTAEKRFNIIKKAGIIK